MIKLFFNFFSHIHLQGADMIIENSRSLICTVILRRHLIFTTKILKNGKFMYNVSFGLPFLRSGKVR